MNWLQFGRLIHAIYRRGRPLPDLAWIESLGLLAVKIAQVHALRIDFLDREKCEHLAKLYRRNSPLPGSTIPDRLDRIGIEEFRQAFTEIDTTPLATASVGQVHRAVSTAGRQLVIKLVKADVRQRFEADIASLKRLLRIATRVYPPLGRVGDPIGIVEDIETYTSSELDLRNEVAGQALLRNIRDLHADRFDLSALEFPEILPELSNDRVMVSAYVEGETIDELLDRRALSYERLLELFRVHGFFMFVAGTFHGDLHPGNVIVSGEQFFLIDTGYVATVDDRLRDGLFDYFAALSEYDYPACVDALQSMSTRTLDPERLRAFRDDFIDLYADFAGSTVSDVSLTQKMMRTIRMSVLAGMSFDRGMFSIIRSLMYMDGMVLRCNPRAELVRDMRPIIASMTAAQG